MIQSHRECRWEDVKLIKEVQYRYGVRWYRRTTEESSKTWNCSIVDIITFRTHKPPPTTPLCPPLYNFIEIPRLIFPGEVLSLVVFVPLVSRYHGRELVYGTWFSTVTLPFLSFLLRYIVFVGPTIRNKDLKKPKYKTFVIKYSNVTVNWEPPFFSKTKNYFFFFFRVNESGALDFM